MSVPPGRCTTQAKRAPDHRQPAGATGCSRKPLGRADARARLDCQRPGQPNTAPDRADKPGQRSPHRLMRAEHLSKRSPPSVVRNTALAESRPASHHHVGPTGDSAGQLPNRVFQRSRAAVTLTRCSPASPPPARPYRPSRATRTTAAATSRWPTPRATSGVPVPAGSEPDAGWGGTSPTPAPDLPPQSCLPGS